MHYPDSQRLPNSPTVYWTRRRLWAEALLLTGIFGLGLALRFFRLDQWSFWPDEVFSFGLKSDGFNDSWLRRSLATDLIRLAVGWLGASEWSARLAPALIGSISGPLLYWPLRRCLGRPGALATAALLSVSLWHIYWSQNARFYTLLFLFFNLGLLLFYLGLEEDRPWLLVAALALFGLAARERMAALLGMPALALYIGVLLLPGFGRPRGLNVRNMALFWGPALLAGALLAGPYLRDWQGWLAGFGRINNSPLFLLGGVLYYVSVPLAAFAAGSALLLAKLRSRFALLLILAATVPLALIMGVSLFQYAANRYIFFSLFSWLALAGFGLQLLADRLPKDARLLALAVAGALVAASLADLFLYFTQQNGNRADWRAAFAYIEQHGAPGDRVVSSDYDVFAYYLGDPFVYAPWDAQDLPDQPAGARTWYVEDLVVEELYPQQLEWVEQQAQPAADYSVLLPQRTFPMRVYSLEAP